MPLSMDDVKQHMGSVPIIDPGIVYGEICRRLPMGGQELQGIKKSQMIQKVIMDILEQPQISGQSKWEDRFLYAKCNSGTPQEKKKMAKDWMEKSRRALSIQPREYEEFFTWLKGFENSPWQIEDINSVHRTIKVMDKSKDLLVDLTYDGAMNILRKSLGWSDADVFEYWDWKKSMGIEATEALFKEFQTPGGYKLCYTDYGEDGGHVVIQKSMLSNKSFISPDLRGREVVTVIHKSMNGSEVELGTFWGMDAMDQGYKLGKSFANKMAKLNKGEIPVGDEQLPPARQPKEKKQSLFNRENEIPVGDEQEQQEDMGKGISFDGSNLLSGDSSILTMTVDQLYNQVDGLRKDEMAGPFEPDYDLMAKEKRENARSAPPRMKTPQEKGYEPGQHWRAPMGPPGYQTESAVAFTDPKTHVTKYPSEEERKNTGINKKV